MTSDRARRWGKVVLRFAGRTGVQLVNWVVIAVLLTFLVRWQSARRGNIHGGMELTGKEPAANLTRLHEAPRDGSDPAEQSNQQNFAMPPDMQESKVDVEIFLHPDCTPNPDVFLYVRQAPLHGSARIASEPNYSWYDKDGQRGKCNLLAVRSPTIFYRRNAGFVGHDRFTVEVFEPGGFVRLTKYSIDAR